MIFTIEETSLMQAFDRSSRGAAIMDIMSQLTLIQDEELKTACSKMAKKLETMTDEEFHTVDYLMEEADYD